MFFPGARGASEKIHGDCAWRGNFDESQREIQQIISIRKETKDERTVAIAFCAAPMQIQNKPRMDANTRELKEEDYAWRFSFEDGSEQRLRHRNFWRPKERLLVVYTGGFAVRTAHMGANDWPGVVRWEKW